ncbi:hypothetical protein IJ732_00290 [bacterium]|nr:hypothetical protein [bacterium]
MQISNIKCNNLQSIASKYLSTVTNPIKGLVQKYNTKNTSLALGTAVGAAALSGAYITKKSQDYNQNLSLLKSAKLNDETANKVLNLKNDEGKIIFSNKNIKALVETEALKDKTFFSTVMKNIDGIQTFNATVRNKTHFTYDENKISRDNPYGKVIEKIPTKTYHMQGLTSDGKQIDITMSENKNNIITDTIIKDGNLTTYVMRTYTNGDVDETTEVTEKVTRRLGTKRHPRQKITEEKTISKENWFYYDKTNRIKRQDVDLKYDELINKNKTTTFSPQGEILTTVVSTYDNTMKRNIFDRKMSKAQLEEFLGEKVSNKYIADIKNGSMTSKNINKISHCTSVQQDFVHNAHQESECSFDATLMHSMKRTYKDPKTGRTVTQKMNISDVPGVYNSTITDDMGNTRTESFARKNPDGSIYVEKNLVSLDGTKTHYINEQSKDGSQVKMHYQIKTAQGEVLTTVDRTFNRVSPNLAYSSVNGHSYVIEKKDKSYEVTDNLNGLTTIIPFKDIFKNNKTYSKAEVFDKLSGDMLLDFYNRGYKFRYIDNPDECYMEEQEMVLCVKDDLFDYSHEAGHIKDLISSFEEEGYTEEEINDLIHDNEEHKMIKISSHPEFRKAYEQERADFMKAFPGVEQKYIDYFIDRVDHYGGFLGGAIEVVAESNALLSTSTGSASDDTLQTRSHYLQKFFPRTIAAASKLLMPNGNIFVTDGMAK